jgi:chaperonin GroEL
VQSNKRKPLLIIAPVEGAALQALIVNHVQGNIPSLVLSPPNVLNDREDILMDIAIATGASLISESQGRKVEKATLADLGVVDKVIATKSNAILIGCGGDINEINERVSVLEAKLEQETIPALKERLQMRLAKLTQGISVFYVGGHTEAEIREKKDRVDDAIGATRAALKEGVCAGGGWTYALISDELSLNLKNYSGSFKEGYDIVLRALSTPLYKIYENAGIKDKYVFDVLESNTTNKDIKPEKIKGINAVNGDEGFLFEMGIIDPTLTLITALENSASIAGLLLISSTTINQFNKQ